eukprot:scaffold781_cov123-Isochrysis_galbana.AAC.6
MTFFRARVAPHAVRKWIAAKDGIACGPEMDRCKGCAAVKTFSFSSDPSRLLPAAAPATVRVASHETS